jgi:replicative superfamily II helicase
MQLTRCEVEAVNVIVTTPEKWDVVTTKSDALRNQCGLLIIDKVHMGGAVIESVYRLVKSRQRQVTHCGILGIVTQL